VSDFAPETGPDGRPRPRYGEYATPEEQRARIQQPDATFALEAGEKLEPAPPAAPVAQAPGPRQAAPGARVPGTGMPGAGPGTGTARHPVDRIVTVALLAYGAVNVVFSVMSFFNLADLATQALRILGSTAAFTNDEAARLWGPIAAVVLVIGYLVTLLLAVRRLRSGRLAWWVPLAGAAATYIVVYICLAVPLLGDPAFLDYATTR
jgi:energy-converting hydrogenase Eha subunit C